MAGMTSQRLFLAAVLLLLASCCHSADPEELDLGEGLRVLTTYQPEDCQYRANQDDIIHYHYVGRLGNNGKVFGKSFDYQSPYIVALGQGRIIPGMDRGLLGTCLWERRRISFPPDLGYGQRGVGSTIPPNSSLAFYIRLIRIERGGLVLGEESSIEELYERGLQSYGDQHWQEAVDQIEQALTLFQEYENQTYHCLQRCRVEVGPDLSLNKKQQQTVDKLSTKEPLLVHFLLQAARGRCVRECKQRTLKAKLRSPDSHVLATFRQRMPYSYLHFSYYKLEQLEEGAKCLFTFFFHNPTDELALSNLPYYRQYLRLNGTDFVSREPGTLAHQEAYVAGKNAYLAQQWAESVESFERALALYTPVLQRCRLMCEDILPINLTRADTSETKQLKLAEYGEEVDTMEYYQLLGRVAAEVVGCRGRCAEKMGTVNGAVVEHYLSSHFDHLQFSYYKMGLWAKAAECAATHRVLEPSDHNMAYNIRYYTKEFKLQNDAFTPRQEVVGIHAAQEAEEQLLYLARHGQQKRREGPRGDPAEAAARKEHIEL